MGPDDHQDQYPHSHSAPVPGAAPFAPLPPSRRQRDVNVQWVIVIATAVLMIVGLAVVLAVGPTSRQQTPAPRAPVTEQTCDYRYLSCPTTTGRLR